MGHRAFKTEVGKERQGRTGGKEEVLQEGDQGDCVIFLDRVAESREEERYKNAPFEKRMMPVSGSRVPVEPLMPAAVTGSTPKGIVIVLPSTVPSFPYMEVSAQTTRMVHFFCTRVQRDRPNGQDGSPADG